MRGRNEPRDCAGSCRREFPSATRRVQRPTQRRQARCACLLSSARTRALAAPHGRSARCESARCSRTKIKSGKQAARPCIATSGGGVERPQSRCRAGDARWHARRQLNSTPCVCRPPVSRPYSIPPAQPNPATQLRAATTESETPARALPRSPPWSGRAAACVRGCAARPDG